MNVIFRLEPRIGTLIQAAVIVFLLVVISHVFDKEDKASAEMRTVAAMRR